VAPEITRNRTFTTLIVFLSAVMFGGSILGCFHTPAVIPEELIGKYITTHPEYEDQFFELGSGLIILAFGGGKYKYYNVKRVEKKIIDNRILYTILCANEDKGEEFNFAFFADLERGGIIQFKNKQHVVWEKQKHHTRIIQMHTFSTKVLMPV
jgi:hypothetical protein